MPEHVSHQASKMKQSNKSFKGFSKRALKNKVGRVEERVSVKHVKKVQSKHERLNRARQLQNNKRMELLQKKKLGSKHGTPKLIGLIPLSPKSDLNQLKENLLHNNKVVNDVMNPLPYAQTVSSVVEKREAKFTFVMSTRDPIGVADVAKVADILLLVIAPTEEDGDELGVDMLGNHFLQILKAQGLPHIVGITQGISQITNNKKQLAMTKLCQRYFSSVFEPETKVFNTDTEAELVTLYRYMTHVIPKDITWRQGRAHMLGQQVEYILNDSNPKALEARNAGFGSLYKSGLGTLRITGYIRGSRGITANNLVHLTGFGDFQVISIEGQSEDASRLHDKEKKEYLLSHVTPDSEPLQDLLPVNSLLNEQSLISEKELAEAVASNPQLANTSSLFHTASDGTVSVNAAQICPTTSQTEYKHWHTQNIHKIQSYSSHSSGAMVNAHSIPLISKERTEEDMILNKIWDDIEVSEGSDAEDDENAMNDEMDELSDSELDAGIELGHGFGSNEPTNNNTNPTSNRFFNTIDDEEKDDEEFAYDEDDGMNLAQAMLQKKQLRKDRTQRAEEDVMSTYSMYSVASLRGRALPGSNGTIPIKFQDLPYSEKATRLLSYGARGEDKLIKERKKLEADDRYWVDEPDLDPTITMRARFIRYRGLKSFKHTHWDPNENLPAEYAQIFQFANFNISERNAKNMLEFDVEPEDLDPATAGNRLVRTERSTPVTITLANIPEQMAHFILNNPVYVLLWALFRHEHKISVLHMSLKRHPEYELPIKSKDPMHFQVGFRRFTAAPIFSKTVNGTEKTILQRWFRNDGFTNVTVYGRVTFPSATVLMFPASVLGSYKEEFPFNPLAASGKLLTCDPNKVILKRSVITGYPVETRGFHAVIKHMFFNPEDVRWFKSCELWTKNGLTGRIVDSRGTHGLFKAIFDHKVMSDDTVCIALYKRQFPPWNPAYVG